jgi:hypothetical protein
LDKSKAERIHDAYYICGDFRKGVHDRIIKSLEERLRTGVVKYDFIKTNVDYWLSSKFTNQQSECDLWARHIGPDGKVKNLFFEVKCPPRDYDVSRLKAEKQLRSHHSHLGKGDNNYLFIVMLKEGELMIERMNQYNR